MRFRAPASAANLGPGFDALAVALALYVEVEVKPAPSLMLSSQGEGAALADDPDKHLAVRIVRHVTGDDRFAIQVRSEIPVGRGLGSSAALALAAAAAAGSQDPFAVAARYEGHPENAAASFLGGLVAARASESGPVARRLSLDGAISFVVMVPDREIPTAQARKVLPEQVPLADAARNLGAMGLLVAGLADFTQLVPEATEDRLHQAARTALFPEAPELLDALVAGGAAAACWSGAGPSLLGFCARERANSVRQAASAAMATRGVRGRVLVLEADHVGLQEVKANQVR